jgi:spermidine synthase
MKKWNILEQASTPDGSKLALVEHDGEYLLRVNGRELMSTRRHASELRLGEVACRGLGARARVLIGGLGLGFTLRGALAVLGPGAEVVVAELMPEVVAWNRNPAYPLAAAELADPRVSVAVADVFLVLGREGPFDAIMLDADNGTTAMMTGGNRALYEARGLERVRAALGPKGSVVYWSAGPDPSFERALRAAGFEVRREEVRAWGSGGPRHVLIIGRLGRPAARG